MAQKCISTIQVSTEGIKGKALLLTRTGTEHVECRLKQAKKISADKKIVHQKDCKELCDSLSSENDAKYLFQHSIW